MSKTFQIRQYYVPAAVKLSIICSEERKLIRKSFDWPSAQLGLLYAGQPCAYGVKTSSSWGLSTTWSTLEYHPNKFVQIIVKKTSAVIDFRYI